MFSSVLYRFEGRVRFSCVQPIYHFKAGLGNPGYVKGFKAMRETTKDTHTEASWKLIEFSDLVHYENRFVRMENRRGIVREGILTAFSNGTASILKGRPSQGLSFQVRSQDIVKIEVFD